MGHPCSPLAENGCTPASFSVSAAATMSSNVCGSSMPFSAKICLLYQMPSTLYSNGSARNPPYRLSIVETAAGSIWSAMPRSPSTFSKSAT